MGLPVCPALSDRKCRRSLKIRPNRAGGPVHKLEKYEGCKGTLDVHSVCPPPKQIRSSAPVAARRRPRSLPVVSPHIINMPRLGSPSPFHELPTCSIIGRCLYDIGTKQCNKPGTIIGALRLEYYYQGSPRVRSEALGFVSSSAKSLSRVGLTHGHMFGCCSWTNPTQPWRASTYRWEVKHLHSNPT